MLLHHDKNMLLLKTAVFHYLAPKFNWSHLQHAQPWHNPPHSTVLTTHFDLGLKLESRMLALHHSGRGNTKTVAIPSQNVLATHESFPTCFLRLLEKRRVGRTAILLNILIGSAVCFSLPNSQPCLEITYNWHCAILGSFLSQESAKLQDFHFAPFIY